MDEVEKTDSLQSGDDEAFEARWSKVQRVARIALILFVLAGLSGILGRGPLAQATMGDPGAPLSIDYERVVHYRTPTGYVLHLHPPAGAGDVRIRLGDSLLNGMRIQRIEPAPVATRLTDGGLELVLPVAPGTTDTRVAITAEPAIVGRWPVSFATDAGPVAFHQIVLP